MAAEREEVVVDPDALEPQHLRKQRAQHLLARRARTAHDRRGELGHRQRTPIELAVRRQRQSLQHDKRRRHHVVRQARRHMRAQRRRIGCRTAAGRHHIGHQPLVAGRILARDHGRLRDSAMPHQHGLDLARLDPEPAQLHLRVGTPQELQHPVGAPARQVAGPVHPAPGRAMRVGDEPLTRQPRTAQIAARQPRPRDVKLAGHSRRHRLQPGVQNVSLVVRQRAANRDASFVAAQRDMPGRICRDFRRTIQINEAAVGISVHETPEQIATERLPAESPSRERR